MGITKEQKSEIIATFRKSDSDTGSPEVQIGLLSKRIDYLSEHFKFHKKDNHSRRHLIKLVNSRRKLLAYLKNKEFDRYKQIIDSLGLRK